MKALTALLGVVVLVVLAWASPVGAQDAIEIEYRLDGEPLSEAGSTSPARLEPQTVSTFDVTVTNNTENPLSITTARLRGEMLGMTFLSYDTIVLIDVAPGATEAFSVPIDLYDLDDQATGYLRAEISLLDEEREEIAAKSFAIDVRGRALSSMGLFAIVILVVALLSLSVNGWSLVRRTLPKNRYLRGMRLAMSGLAVGLLIAAAFSILRIFPLPTVGWAPLVIFPTLGAFAFGYIMPSGFLGSKDEEPEELVV